MGESKQGLMVVNIPTKAGGLMGQAQENPIALVQAKFKEVEIRFKGWLEKQSLAVEAAVVTTTGAVQGAAIGAFMGTLAGDASSMLTPLPNAANFSPEAMASLKQSQALAGGPLVQARNFAVMTGVNAGITCVMKKLRGKEDVQSSMVAAFGSGAMFSLVSGMGGPNLAANAVTSGLFFALVQGGIFQMGQKVSQPPGEDVYYVKTRSMLSNLGLQNYEKNFKRGLLTDSTLPLLTDSALRDVKIPPGPRLLILDHIERDPELKEIYVRSGKEVQVEASKAHLGTKVNIEAGAGKVQEEGDQSQQVQVAMDDWAAVVKNGNVQSGEGTLSCSSEE